MNLTEIQDLIKFVAKSGVNEVEIEQKDFKITIKSSGTTRRGRGQQQEVVEAQIMQPMHIPVQPMQMQQPVAQPAPQPAVQAPQATGNAPAAPQEPAGESDETSRYVEIKSPMIGTFYRRPAPDKDLFVEVGTDIKPGKVVCIIEAMKLFNEIEAEISGKIVKVLVDDNTPVEYDQPLFLVDPA